MYQHHEMEALRQLIAVCRPDPVVLDIGANIGVTTLVLADAVGERGEVHAFEPQRVVFQMLMGNVALNSCENVYGHHLALGREPGEIELPPLDYRRSWSFGGLNLHGRSPDPQFSAGAAEADSVRRERVEVRTLDSLGYARVDFIKLDVELMEADVLTGGEQTIRRHRPLMQVERLAFDKGRVPRLLGEWDYAVYRVGINLICVPMEQIDRVSVAGATRVA